MAEAHEEEEIRILLIGRTGHGKSTVGNTLLGGEYFKTSGSCKSCTATCRSEETDRDGVRLVVCDTPGFFDTTLSNEELTQRIFKSLALTIPGFHVIAFVLKRERFTQEMQKTKEVFFNFFGANVSDYFCIICTHTENDNELQEWLEDPEPDLASFLKECNGAIFPFEKKASPSVKDEQVRSFLQHARKIKGKDGEKYFTNNIYRMVCEEAEKREKERQERERRERDIAMKNEKERKEQNRRALDIAFKKEMEKLEQERQEIEVIYKNQLAEPEHRDQIQDEIHRILQEGEKKRQAIEEKYKRQLEITEQTYQDAIQYAIQELRRQTRGNQTENCANRNFRAEMNKESCFQFLLRGGSTVLMMALQILASKYITV